MITGFHWIFEEKLAGGGLPGLLSPLNKDMDFLQAANFDVVCTLTEIPLIYSAETYSQMLSVHFPITDMDVPEMIETVEIVEKLNGFLDANLSIFLHCRAGKGRTGTILGCMLVTMGREPHEAIQELRKISPHYIETEKQEEFIFLFQNYINNVTEKRTPQKTSSRRSELSELTRPSMEFYQAIGGDETVKRILQKFYDIVFDDEIIGRFFHKSEKRNLREKQFSFLRRCFTGDKTQYMGQRPRNAHHFMIISNEEFDHRQALMRKCLIEDNMSPEHIQKWMAVEEAFRIQIVKEKPQALFVRGVETKWRDTPETIIIEVASICDRCNSEMLLQSTGYFLGEDLLCGVCVK